MPKKKEIIIAGRSAADQKKYGTKGSVLLGNTYKDSASEFLFDKEIHLDVSGAHVVFICGKRGGGKSYTMGVIAEGFSLLDEAVRKNLSIILLDTMGVYWTMGHANNAQRDLLREYGIEPQAINLRIFTPEKYYHIYKKKGIPTTHPFTINPMELSSDDWCMTFRQDKYSATGLLINKVITELNETGQKFSIDDIIAKVKADTDSDKVTKTAVESMFVTACGWGLFGSETVPLHELAAPGEVTVLDVSCYATMPGGWDVKALVVGIISQHLFVQRMDFRKAEEFSQIKRIEDYYVTEQSSEDMPLVWLVIDEAHEFLPFDEAKSNVATQPLITIMREGRQPGISLILATQQPGKIHTDVMTQSDVVLAHRVTARIDVEALGLLAQSYMDAGLIHAMNELPRVHGAAVLFDDLNEKIFKMRTRPRFTWHGGSSPNALKMAEVKKK